MARYRFRPIRFLLASGLTVAVVGLLFWAGCCGANQVKSKIMPHLLDVQTLTWQDITKTMPVEGLVIRREETVKAPATGNLRLLARHGQRLRVGAPLAEIEGTSKHQVWSPGAGVFCTNVDGLENLLVPDMVDGLDLGAVEQMKAAEGQVGDQVSSGELIGKLVDNLQPVLFYFKLDRADNESAQVWQKGATIYLNDEDQRLKGIIKEVRSEQDQLGILVELEQYPQSFVYERHQKVEMITHRATGWLVSDKAIVFKDGRPGLYVINKQKICWIPVTAKDRFDGKVTVAGENLNDSVRYVQNPSWAKEGVRLSN